MSGLAIRRMALLDLVAVGSGYGIHVEPLVTITQRWRNRLVRDPSHGRPPGGVTRGGSLGDATEPIAALQSIALRVTHQAPPGHRHAASHGPSAGRYALRRRDPVGRPRLRLVAGRVRIDA